MRPRELAAWDAIAPPAMRADLLRLLLLYAEAGIWLDARFATVRPLTDFVARTSRNQAFGVVSLLGNGVLVVHRAEDSLLRACIDFILDNIEQRRFDTVLMATGPGALNAVRCVLSPAQRDGIRYIAEGIAE